MCMFVYLCECEQVLIQCRHEGKRDRDSVCVCVCVCVYCVCVPLLAPAGGTTTGLEILRTSVSFSFTLRIAPSINTIYTYCILYTHTKKFRVYIKVQNNYADRIHIHVYIYYRSTHICHAFLNIRFSV